MSCYHCTKISSRRRDRLMSLEKINSWSILTNKSVWKSVDWEESSNGSQTITLVKKIMTFFAHKYILYTTLQNTVILQKNLGQHRTAASVFDWQGAHMLESIRSVFCSQMDVLNQYLRNKKFFCSSEYWKEWKLLPSKVAPLNWWAVNLCFLGVVSNKSCTQV